MKPCRIIDAAITKVTVWFLFVSVLCLVVMMVLLTIDIITTKFFNMPIPGVTEIVEDLNIPLVFMAMAYVQLERGHIAGPIFENRFSATINNYIKIGGYFLGILITSFVAWRSISLLKEMLAVGEVKSGAIHFPLWPFALSSALSFVLFALTLALSIVRLLAFPEQYGQSDCEDESIN
ncbi:MAG: TRAP transporter small permease subunit [Candidatus Hodarchaeota archaeon]